MMISISTEKYYIAWQIWNFPHATAFQDFRATAGLKASLWFERSDDLYWTSKPNILDKPKRRPRKLDIWPNILDIQTNHIGHPGQVYWTFRSSIPDISRGQTYWISRPNIRNIQVKHTGPPVLAYWKSRPNILDIWIKNTGHLRPNIMDIKAKHIITEHPGQAYWISWPPNIRFKHTGHFGQTYWTSRPNIPAIWAKNSGHKANHIGY